MSTAPEPQQSDSQPVPGYKKPYPPRKSRKPQAIKTAVVAKRANGQNKASIARDSARNGQSARESRSLGVTGLGVYIFKYQGKPLYIGSTKELSERPNKRDAAHASRWQAILESTATELIPCDSLLKAKQMEEQLIRSLKPHYNQRNPRAEADIERTTRIIRENW